MAFTDKIKEIITNIPIVNLLPILEDLATRIPKAYDAMPEDQKQKLASDLLAAGGKAAASYAG